MSHDCGARESLRGRAGKVHPEMTYRKPRKEILSEQQLAAFPSTQTYVDVISYIETLNESVIGVKLTDECSVSDVSAAHTIDSESKTHKPL
jgi:hypothetical protein